MDFVEVRELYDKFGGDCVIPIYDNRKHSLRSGWNNTIFQLSEFVNATGIALNMLNVNKKFDIACLDIDLKDESITYDNKLKVNKLLNEVKRYDGIYLERTRSGGFHLFFKIKNEDLNRIHDTYTIDDVYVANHIELYPSKKRASRLVLIAPSYAEGGSYINIVGDLSDLEYISIKNLHYIINEFNNILGKRKLVKTKTFVGSNKNIELNVDLKYNEFKDNLNDDLKYKLLELERVIKSGEYITKLLSALDISFKDMGNKINIYSIITNDGNNLDAYIFKQNLVYHDFHNNKSYKFIYLLYILYKDKIDKILDNISTDNDCNNNDNNNDIIHNKNNVISFNSFYELDSNILNGKVLLKAQTGSGKTRFIKELAYTGNDKIIMLEPLTTQVLQEEKVGLKYVSCFCEGSKSGYITDKTKLIFATYDKLPTILNLVNIDEWKLVIDEAHELICAISYRKRQIELIWSIINGREQTLLMTATDELLYLSDYVDKTYKLVSKNKTNRYFRIIDGNKVVNKIVSNVIQNYDDDVTQFVYIDSKSKLDTIYNTLLDNGIRFEDVVVITSDNKTINANDIINDMDVKRKIYLTTRVLSAGFHILSGGCFIYHIIPSDINILLQEINRVREYKGNIVYVNIYNSYYKKTTVINFNIYWNKLYNYKIKLINKMNDMINDNLENKIGKEYLSGINYVYSNAIENEYWLRFIVYNQIMKEASKNNKYLIDIITNEGFEYTSEEPVIVEIDILSDNDSDTINNIYGDYFDKYINYGTKPDIKTADKIEIDIYYLCKRIKENIEIFEEDDIYNIRQKVVGNKISDCKRKITALLNKYAVNNLDKTGKKTNGIIKTKFYTLKDKLIYNSYKPSTLEKICKNIGLTTVERKKFLEDLSFKYDKQSKRYIRCNNE